MRCELSLCTTCESLQVSTYRICCVKVPLVEVSGQLETAPSAVLQGTNAAVSHGSGGHGADDAEPEFVGEVLYCSVMRVSVRMDHLRYELPLIMCCMTDMDDPGVLRPWQPGRCSQGTVLHAQGGWAAQHGRHLPLPHRHCSWHGVPAPPWHRARRPQERQRAAQVHCTGSAVRMQGCQCG